MLVQMLLIRAFEMQLAGLASQQLLPGMQILAVGQEAVAVGVVHALAEDDVIVTNHRSHGHILARGADPGSIMAEIMGKAAGVNHGKAGTLHLAVPEKNILMTSTVVGASPLLAVGAAFAQHYQGSSALSAVFFGDGAAAEGSVHEAMNLAAVWKLPVLFVCENNCWAGAQGLTDHCPVGQLACRAASYGMDDEVVDGNDADAVLAAASRLVESIRAGRGPAMLEAKTYRMRGHGESDHQLYVSKDELARWAERDPIDLYAARLAEEGLLAPDALAALRSDADRQVEQALAFAQDSPLPPPEDALAHLWAGQDRR